MKKTKVVLFLFTVLVLVGAASLYENTPASAQMDSPEVSAAYYLKIEGIPGEAIHELHNDEIVIDSFQWNESLPLASGGSRPGTGAAAGRVVMEDFFFTAPVSKASPKLMQSVADGSRFQEAVFTVRSLQEADSVILEAKLQDVGITSYHFAGFSNRPTDNFSLNFSKITYTYNVLDEAGNIVETVVGSWNLKTNTP